MVGRAPGTSVAPLGEPPQSLPADGLSGFRPIEVDFGDVPWNSELNFAATFANAETENVVIEALRTSCGCTVTSEDYTRRLIPAHADLPITGSIRIGDRLGRRVEDVSILLNTGALHQLQVSANVIPTYRVLPTQIEFGAVDIDGDSGDPTEVLEFASETAQIVGQPHADVHWLRVFPYTVKDGETQIMVRLVRAKLPHGSQTGRVVVSTDDEFRPEFSILVSAVGTAQLRPAPERAFLSPGEQVNIQFVRPNGQTATLAGGTFCDAACPCTLLIKETHAEVSVATGGKSPGLYRLDVNATDGAKGHIWVGVIGSEL